MSKNKFKINYSNSIIAVINFTVYIIHVHTTTINKQTFTVTLLCPYTHI